MALHDDAAKPGVSVPGYSAGVSMGLSLIGLRLAGEDPGVTPSEYKRDADRTLGRFADILQRLGVGTEGFTPDVLEMMVRGSGDTRLYYAKVYALPPIVKMAIGRLKDCYDKLQFIMQFA
jgi:hypothetical protein